MTSPYQFLPTPRRLRARGSVGEMIAVEINKYHVCADVILMKKMKKGEAVCILVVSTVPSKSFVNA